MMQPSDLPTLYRNHRLILWVEDEVTKTYLHHHWQDADIGLLMAGGHENIYAVVKSSRAQGFVQVFGFRDRDFGETNRAKWSDGAVEVLTSEAFEIENLALDSQAMSMCQLNTSGKSAAEIEAALRALAQKRLWWMSCRRTIAEIRTTATHQFVSHPKLGNVSSEQQATDAILNSAWWKNTLPAIPTTLTEHSVRDKLAANYSHYAAALQHDSWRDCFSGKELLQEIVSAVWTKGRPAESPSARVHLDFIRAIVEAQREQSRIPQEVEELRRALRQHLQRAVLPVQQV